MDFILQRHAHRAWDGGKACVGLTPHTAIGRAESLQRSLFGGHGGRLLAHRLSAPTGALGRSPTP